MARSSEYAVVYDISDDIERAKVEKILKGFGFRVQKSVFECKMDKKTKTELIERLKNLDIKTGFIKIYRLEYYYKSEIIGKRNDNDIDSGYAFVV